VNHHPDTVPISDAQREGETSMTEEHHTLGQPAPSVPAPAGSPPGPLVTEAERERALTQLREACVDGRLTLEEFSDRVDTVLTARTQADLAPVIEDIAVVRASVPSRRQPARHNVAIMGSSKRRGRWRIDEQSSAIAFMGECEVDLRHAEVPAAEVEITAIAFMGSVKIFVPPGVDVDMTGVAIMGNKEEQLAEVRLLPGAPLIRVRAYALMGEVKVESRD